MPIKDPEKRREYQRQYRKEHPNYQIDVLKKMKKNPERYKQHCLKGRQYHSDNRERRNKTRLESYYKTHPNSKPRITHYDFETHRELAINSGIQQQREWYECHKMGLMPDGIYRNLHEAFRRQ